MSTFKEAYSWLINVIEGIETGEGHSGRVPRLTSTEWGELSHCLQDAIAYYVDYHTNSVSVNKQSEVSEARQYYSGLFQLVCGLTNVQTTLTAQSVTTSRPEELQPIREHVEKRGLQPLN